MLAVLTFVFSSFWIWLGTMMLIGTISNGVYLILLGIRGKSKKGDGNVNIDMKSAENILEKIEKGINSSLNNSTKR